MHALRRVCGLIVFSILAGLTVHAQEKVDPQPKDTSIPRGFRMYFVNDTRYGAPEVATKLIDPKRAIATEGRNRVGKLHDPVTEHGLFSVIGVWSRTIPTTKEEPVVKLLERVEEVTKKYQLKRMGAFAAFLGLKKEFEEDDDRDKRMAEIANLSKDFKFLQTGLAEETSAQNTAWGLDAKNEDMSWKNQITVVLYHRFKIVGRWEFATDKPPTEADLDKIAAAVDVLMGKKPSETKKDEPKVEPKAEPK